MLPQLQGQNEGILTIATTNHPERIDDAILNRPSRFDVKYDFALPAALLRVEYILKWIQKTQQLVENAPWRVIFEEDVSALAQAVADKTDGWSFAFLKELYVLPHPSCWHSGSLIHHLLDSFPSSCVLRTTNRGRRSTKAPTTSRCASL